MKIIGNATKKLVERLCSLCPACNTPGFGVREVKYGLLCEACVYPTRSIRSHIYCCQKCNFSNEKKFPGGKQTEDPMFCDHCNP